MQEVGIDLSVDTVKLTRKLCDTEWNGLLQMVRTGVAAVYGYLV